MQKFPSPQIEQSTTTFLPTKLHQHSSRNPSSIKYRCLGKLSQTPGSRLHKSRRRVSQLPTNLLSLIISFLSPKYYLNSFIVCRRFSHLNVHSGFWKGVVQLYFPNELEDNSCLAASRGPKHQWKELFVICVQRRRLRRPRASHKRNNNAVLMERIGEFERHFRKRQESVESKNRVDLELRDEAHTQWTSNKRCLHNWIVQQQACNNLSQDLLLKTSQWYKTIHHQNSDSSSKPFKLPQIAKAKNSTTNSGRRCERAHISPKRKPSNQQNTSRIQRVPHV
mmetsp:Transcript_2493/g.9383  ORF Transcript_2493/g.9383 Transcript_2493/m.9383 type:complete len:280 (+) Transcript_2493:954-1793(+)